MPKSAKLSFLAVSVAVVVCLFLGVNWHGVHAAGVQAQQADAYREISVYQEVLQHVQNDYVEDPNIGAVTNGALRGLMESLDADSSYLSAADYKTYKEQKPGRAQVGLVVSKRYGYATIVSVVAGSPADKADLDDGDMIEAVEGRDTRDLSLPVIERMLEGAPGSELKLAVLRPRSAVPDKISLSRVVVSVPPVSETMYENSTILYLKPVAMDREHVSATEAKLKSLAKTPGKKVLLDLRDVATGDMAEGRAHGEPVPGQGNDCDARRTEGGEADIHRGSREGCEYDRAAGGAGESRDGWSRRACSGGDCGQQARRAGRRADVRRRRAVEDVRAR